MDTIKITAANLAQSVIIETPCTADWNDNCPRALRRLRDLRNKTFSAVAKAAALATLFISACLPSAASGDNDKEKGCPQPNKIKSQAAQPLKSVQPVVSPGYQNTPATNVTAGVPMMPDLTGYMTQLNTKLLATWKQAGNPKQSEKDQSPTTVSFTIDKAGAITLLKVIKSSKQAAVDEEAMKAVRNSLPLPLPPSGSGQLALEFTFDPKSATANEGNKPEQKTKEQNDGH